VQVDLAELGAGASSACMAAGTMRCSSWRVSLDVGEWRECRLRCQERRSQVFERSVDTSSRVRRARFILRGAGRLSRGASEAIAISGGAIGIRSGVSRRHEPPPIEPHRAFHTITGSLGQSYGCLSFAPPPREGGSLGRTFISISTTKSLCLLAASLIVASTTLKTTGH
jgi:hypothetical protein